MNYRGMTTKFVLKTAFVVMLFLMLPGLAVRADETEKKEVQIHLSDFRGLRNAGTYVRQKNGVWIDEKARTETNTKKVISIIKKQWLDNNDCDTTVENVKPATARLMFVGDLMCLAGQQHGHKVKTGFDFSNSFRYLTPLFNEADLLTGNLETLIAPSSPITSVVKTTESGTPLCNGPKAWLNAVKSVGFDLLVNANNHICDWGPGAIDETLGYLDCFGFAHTGSCTEADYTAEGKGSDRFVIVDVKGIKLAVLSYTHIVNQRGKMRNGQLAGMVNLFESGTYEEDIKAARDAGADFVAVYCHWGTENTHAVTAYQKNDARAVAEAGADLIIGSHPHCLQDGEYIECADGRRVLCMYSLGNFVSSMGSLINNDTVILDITLERSTEGTVISKASYIPCYVRSGSDGTNVITPIGTADRVFGKKDMLKESRSRIAGVISVIEEELR